MILTCKQLSASKNICINLLLLVTIVFMFPQYSSAELSVPVRTNKYIDEYLYRMSSRYDIPLPPNFFNQPMTSQEINTFLSALDSLNLQSKLSTQEAAQLRRVDATINGTHSLYTYRDTTRDLLTRVRLNLSGDLNASSKDSTDLYIRGMASPRIEGNIRKLSYYAEMNIWTDYRSDTIYHMSSYNPYDGIPYNIYNEKDSAHIRSSDLPRGGIYLDASPFQAATGIDYLRVGPCIYNPLMFSGDAPPETFGRLWMDLGIAKYTHTAGLLKSQKDRDKFFYTHRLEFTLWKKRIRLGINESIVYGSTTNQPGDPVNPKDTGVIRNWEWTYLIPFVPFKFVEHYNGDRDNALISGDIDVMYPQNYRWYGEFLIDDMESPWQLFTSNFHNKWAYTIGMQWFGRMMDRDVVAGCEYTHIEPWVYTHFNGGSHRWDNYNQPLGSQLGPDAEQLRCDLRTDLTDKFSAGFSFIYTGRDPSARGGKITDVFQDSVSPVNHGDSNIKTFLGSQAVRSVMPALTGRFNPLGQFWIDALVGYDSQAGFVFKSSGAICF